MKALDLAASQKGCWRKIAIVLKMPFHEKAGWSQVDSFWSLLVMLLNLLLQMPRGGC